MKRLPLVPLAAMLLIVASLAGCATVTAESPAASPDLREGRPGPPPQRTHQAP
jgi:hypothetical protein